MIGLRATVSAAARPYACLYFIYFMPNDRESFQQGRGRLFDLGVFERTMDTPIIVTVSQMTDVFNLTLYIW